MQENNNEAILTIFTVVALLVLIGIIMIFIAVYYTNSKRKLIREKEFLKASYEQAILQAQFEIQDQTLKNASQEIHDNIGQVLSYVSLSLDRASTLDEAEKDGIIMESKQLVNQSMNDLRDLSKSFSLDNITSDGLTTTIKTEVLRLNKSRLINARLDVEGTILRLPEHHELVLFRILQEFSNNTLKHAKARNLSIVLTYQQALVEMMLKDDGVGFDFESQQNKSGSGLKNMQKRGALIGAQIASGSETGAGSWLQVILPITTTTAA